MPVIVNWKQDFHTDKDGIGPSQLGKITGLLDFLDWATDEKTQEPDRLRDDDIVVMIDAHDVWFQLPPDVLLRRYYASNVEANQRISLESDLDSEYGPSTAAAAASSSIEQTIVVSAQKGCVAPRDTTSNMHCNDVPESTLPKDVYGFLTDFDIFKHKYMRPRWVNSGTFMGPVGDMQRYFRRVKDKMDHDLDELTDDQELGGDQGIFAEAFGEQEIWRSRMMDPGATEEERDAAVQFRDRFEYHVGLDYRQLISYPTCYSEKDGDFVKLGVPGHVRKKSRQFGVVPPRIGGIPSDMYQAQRPFGRYAIEGTVHLTWGAVPLYTDFWTTATPVMLHHNAWRDGLKERRVTWWDRTWFFPHLRELLVARLLDTKTEPLLVVPLGSNESLRVWPYTGGSQEDHRSQAPLVFGRSMETKEWALQTTKWDAVCRNDNQTLEERKPWHQEVFRDRLGPLVY